jgi:hypothetical protein
MPIDSIWLFTASVVAYFVVLLVPGLAVGLAAGLRGWTLAGLAPLFGYTVHGLTGPWLSGLGFAYTLWSALIATALFAAVVYAIRRYVENRWPERERPQQGLLPNWGRNAHLGVILCIGIAFVVSSVVLIAAAEGELDAIPQRWDPVFHANGIRYIAETGDGGLYGVSSVNRYGPEGSQFYPNAYHLAGSLVYMITGATVPTVINAMTLPIAGLFGLSMAALVRECGGRSVLAGAAALTAAAVNSGVYESISNGLVPFALSTAFTPLAPMIMHRYLVRPNVTNGMVLVLAAAGLLVVHSSALFAGLLFAVPMLIHRWWTESSTIGKDIKHLLPIAVAGGALTILQLLGALDQAAGAYGYRPWNSAKPIREALWHLFMFQHTAPYPQYVLVAFLVIGVLTYRRLNGLRWMTGAALIFGTFWMLVACWGGLSWVIVLSRPWWNDHFRMIALAMIPFSLLVAHGMAETQRWLAKVATERLPGFTKRRSAVRVGSAAAVVVVIGVASLGFYAPLNKEVVAHAYHKSKRDRAGEMGQIAVTPLEEKAMYKMAEIAEPGERVMNDRNDGSVWLYALTGVKSVAAHYDDNVPPKDAALLADHFREYPTNPEVRAAVKRLNIKHVFVGDGSRYPLVKPDLGLVGLDKADWVRVVYRNPDATIYEIDPKKLPSD